MYEVQRLAIDKIYASPNQDKQFRFSMIQVTDPLVPARGSVILFKEYKKLPDNASSYHVYTIGGLSPYTFNLLTKKHLWALDKWVNVEEDMNLRSYLMQFYNDDGVVFPRKKFWYLATTNSLSFAFKVDRETIENFDHTTCKYFRIYSNQRNTNEEVNSNAAGNPIRSFSRVVNNNVDKQTIQNQIADLEANGGKCLVYVNGYYTPKLRLSIPDGSTVEVIYDTSIETVETFTLGELRTFLSTKDERVKYFVYRERNTNNLQYEDDLEIYLTAEYENKEYGTYYYQHKMHALTNVTDKDFALDTIYTNNQASDLMAMFGGNIQDKKVVILTRRSAVNKELAYSSAKFHELYKLPHNVQRDVVANSNVGIPHYRVENLEDHNYFKLMSVDTLAKVTNTFATSTMGYNGVTHYLGNTPNKVTNQGYVDVPFLYRKHGLAYEYDSQGKMLGYQLTDGALYHPLYPETVNVEFISGITAETFVLYEPSDLITIDRPEHKIVACIHYSNEPQGNWRELTVGDGLIEVEGGYITDLPLEYRVRVLYEDSVVAKDLYIPTDSTIFLANINVADTVGGNYMERRLDIDFEQVEVFLNGNRLTYKLDFFYKKGSVLITNKKYIDYSLDKQLVHVRMTNPTTDPTSFNEKEVRGFISDGVLTRNCYYDILDDKIFSTFVDGKLRDRDSVIFSENDNTVRIDDVSNGLPYTVARRVIPIHSATGLPTRPYFNSNEELNASISTLFNYAYPEPKLDNINVIRERHIVYSPIVALAIKDVMEGIIPPEVYTKENPERDILELFEDRYKFYMDMDPVRESYTSNLVGIHPHAGIHTKELNLFQYRFIERLVSHLTNDTTSEVVLSRQGGVLVSANIGESHIPSHSGPTGTIVVP